MDFDAIIVGAGPAGTTAAEAIAREGYDVLVLEEHPQVGIPQHCAGKISVNALKELNLPMTGVLQHIRGARFYSPDMNSLSVERKETQAYIFDRTALDKELAKRAVDAGAILLTSAQATDVSIDPHGVNVLFKHEDRHLRLKARIVIGADGASSSIARRLGLYSKERATVRVAIQREVAGLHNVESGFVEVYLGGKYAPGFFAWIVPTREDSVKAGLCVKPSQGKYLLSYMENFVKSHPIAKKKLEGGTYTRQTAHVIPTGGTLHQTVSDGALIVGDAAGQVKSATGGGLYYGMVCAKIAGRVVSKALSSGEDLLRKDVLMEYQRLWRERLGREIEMSIKMRLLLDLLTDDEVNDLFRIVREDEALIDLIEAEGDIDWQSKLSVPLLKHVASALAKRPRLLLKLGRFMTI